MQALGMALALAALAGGGKIKWENDYAKGLELAKKDGKLLLLYFTADWCGPCKRLSAGAFSDDAAVKAAAEKVVAVYVDCTKPGQNQALQEKYKIEGYPTVLFVDPSAEKAVADVYPKDGPSFAAEIGRLAREHAKK